MKTQNTVRDAYISVTIDSNDIATIHHCHKVYGRWQRSINKRVQIDDIGRKMARLTSEEWTAVKMAVESKGRDSTLAI